MISGGSGRALVIARLLHDFDVCKGIEVLENLNGAAQIICKRFEVLASDVLDARTSKKIQVQCNSMLDVDWSDGDVVFANSTCFEDDLMGSMARQAEKVKTRALISSLLRRGWVPTPSTSSSASAQDELGPATVFIHVRKNLDGSSFEAPPL